MKTHVLKCWPEHYSALTHPDPALRKTGELRLNDRDYQVGDDLLLYEWDPNTENYTGGFVLLGITHVLSGGPWLADRYVMLSLTPFRSLGSPSDGANVKQHG